MEMFTISRMFFVLLCLPMKCGGLPIERVHYVPQQTEIPMDEKGSNENSTLPYDSSICNPYSVIKLPHLDPVATEYYSISFTRHWMAVHSPGVLQLNDGEVGVYVFNNQHQRSTDSDTEINHARNTKLGKRACKPQEANCSANLSKSTLLASKHNFFDRKYNRDFYHICVEITFAEPTVEAVLAISDLETFKQEAIKHFCEKVDVPLETVGPTVLHTFKRLKMDIYFLPIGRHMETIDVRRFVLNMQYMMNAGHFSFVFQGTKQRDAYMAVMSSSIKVLRIDQMEWLDKVGLRLLAIFPIVSAFYLLLGAIEDKWKMYGVRKHVKQIPSIIKERMSKSRKLSAQTSLTERFERRSQLQSRQFFDDFLAQRPFIII